MPPTTDPTVTPPPAAPATRRELFRMPRREFFVGGVAGLLAAKGIEQVQPIEWTKAALPYGTYLSFAQFGEDLVAQGLFRELKVDKPTYLDVGAYEPIRANNTYLFYRKGGHGVLVEPNPGLTRKLRRERPGDVVLQAGIGITDAAEADYYVFAEDQLNTFDKSQVEHITTTSNIPLVNTLKMPLLAINRVIAEHFGGAAPDFVSIDIEGLDLAILKTLDFDKYRPKIFCVETVITGTFRHNPETTDFLRSKGYEVRGMTHANMIYVDGRLTG